MEVLAGLNKGQSKMLMRWVDDAVRRDIKNKESEEIIIQSIEEAIAIGKLTGHLSDFDDAKYDDRCGDENLI